MARQGAGRLSGLGGRGEVHFIHHLAGFYADAREDGAQAVKWARQDFALRQTYIRARGLWHGPVSRGRFAESRGKIEEALGGPASRTRTFTYHAGLIFSAAGEIWSAVANA